MYTVDEWNALKYINNCDEVACGKPYDIKRHAQTLSPSQKKIILNYLKKGKVMAVTAGGVYDYVIDDMTGITIHAYTDDEYQWNMHIASSSGRFCGANRTRSAVSGHRLNCSWLTLIRSV